MSASSGGGRGFAKSDSNCVSVSPDNQAYAKGWSMWSFYNMAQDHRRTCGSISSGCYSSNNNSERILV